MSEINYQEGHETAGQAKPVAWRYRYVKKGITDSQGEPWVGDWKYVPTKEDCNDRPSYEIQALFTAPPVPLTSEGLVKAVRFYEQVKRENPPVETGAWKDAVDWVLKEACSAVILGKADNPPASGNQVSELTMWVKRLVSQLKKSQAGLQITGEGDGLPEAKRTDKRGGCFTVTWPEAFTTAGIAMAVALVVYSICRWG